MEGQRFWFLVNIWKGEMSWVVNLVVNRIRAEIMKRVILDGHTIREGRTAMIIIGERARAATKAAKEVGKIRNRRLTYG